MKSKKWLIGILVVLSLLLVLSGCGKTKKEVMNIDHEDSQDVEILYNQRNSVNYIFQSMKDEGLVDSQVTKISTSDYSNYEGPTGLFDSHPDLEDNSVFATVHILNNHDEAVELANYTSAEGGEDSFVYGNVAVHINGDLSQERSEMYQSKLPDIIRNEYERSQEEQKAKEEAEAQKKEEEEKNREIKNSLNALKGHSLSEVVNKVSELGYTATYETPSGEDRTAEVSGFDAETLENWQMTSVLKVNTEHKTVNLQISTNDAVEKENAQDSLEENFPVYYAWKALGNYGEQLYPYGFKVHDIIGVYAEEPVDENTWFLKADVTITNMYGADYDTVVEGKVTGNKNSQEVISFFVYD